MPRVAGPSRRLLLAAGTALSLLVLAPAEATAPPATWGGSGAASGVRLVLTTDPPALPVQHLVELSAAEAVTTWGSSSPANAHASALHPGENGTGGLAMLCSFGFPCPAGFPPDYPLDAAASYPLEPEQGSATGVARARADAREVHAEVGLEAVLDDDAPLAPFVTAADAIATSTQALVDDRLTVRSEVALTDVALAGGVVRIAALDALSVSRAGRGEPTSEVQLEVAGVTTASGEVLVGSEGVRLAGAGTDPAAVRDLNAALARALDGQPVSLRAVGASTAQAGGGSSGEVSGLVATVRRNVSGPPAPQVDRLYRSYVAQVVLGAASSSARASHDAPHERAAVAPVAPPAPLPPPATAPEVAAEAVVKTLEPALPSQALAPPPARPPQLAPVPRAGIALLGGDAARAVEAGYALLVGLAGLALAQRAHRARRLRSEEWR